MYITAIDWENFVVKEMSCRQIFLAIYADFCTYTNYIMDEHLHSDIGEASKAL